LCFGFERVNVNVNIETDHYFTGFLLHLAFNFSENSQRIEKIESLLRNGADINKSVYQSTLALNQQSESPFR
jgi:hypothetical protein